MLEEAEPSLEVERDRSPHRSPGVTYVVYGFIAWSYICVCWIVFVPWWSAGASVATILITFFITLGALLTTFNYYKSINTSPGYPPADWQPAHATEEQLQEAIKNASLTRNNAQKKAKKSVRYCAKCSAFKPPRAHHCTECNRCILKMDHHCPWIDNCVGFFNQKYFLLFLFYGIASQAATVVLFAATLVSWASDKPDPSTPDNKFPSSFSVSRMIMMIFDTMFMVPATLGMTGLFCFQVYLVKANTTNIETFEVELDQRDAPASKPYRWMYDRGAFENLQEVLGQSVWEWFIPTPVPGDGIRWRRSSLSPPLEEA